MSYPAHHPKDVWQHYAAMPGGCWEWTGKRNWQGYGRYSVKGRLYMAHRLAWEATHGPIPPGLFICHRCDNPPCINPAHLFLGTPHDNTLDGVRKGRIKPLRCPPDLKPRGERVGSAKLTDADVVRIRLLRAQGASLNALAESFRVSEATVSLVARGLSWRHVA